MSEPVTILTAALELKPGSVYALESDGRLIREDYAAITNQLKDVRERLGIEFVLLSGGLHIVREEVDPQ